MHRRNPDARDEGASGFTKNVDPMAHGDIPKLSAQDLLEQFALPRAEPGSIVHEAMRAALAVRIAEMQLNAAQEATRWASEAARRAKLSAVATTLASLVALIALLVAAL